MKYDNRRMLILTIIDAVDSREESTESPELASGAGLGVVELTVALHHVYDTPRDEICRRLNCSAEGPKDRQHDKTALCVFVVAV